MEAGSNMMIALIAISLGGMVWLWLLLLEKRKQQTSLLKKTLKKVPITSERMDYSVYTMSFREKSLTILLAGLLFGSIGFIFYKSLFAAWALALLGFTYPKIRSKQYITKRKQALSLQFKQALYILSSSLGAGKSLENAFRETTKDLLQLYGDENTLIIKELELINRRIENGEQIEIGLREFSQRSHVEDVANFSDVFITCKRTGGDLVEIIRRTSNMIGDKLDIQQEIAVMIAQKKFEAKAMGIMPFGIIAFLGFGSNGYMDPLYGNAKGILLMTVVLLGLLFCYLITQKIMNIKV
jgi:tight adherence protein B